MAKEFYNKRNRDCTQRLWDICGELPSLCREFFVGIEHTTTPLTRLNYAYDLRIFFKYISEVLNFDIKNISYTDLNKITSQNIEAYLSYLSFYNLDGKECSCSESGKSRKLAVLRTFFKYFFNKDLIASNVASKVTMPKIRDKSIVRLEIDEVSTLLSLVESGEHLSPAEKRYHNYTKLRDIAMLTLFLGTGIRVSECVGLNVTDIDFNINGFSVIRKGGSQTVLYFSDEVAEPLRRYIEERAIKLEQNKNSTENALFLSLQNKRMSVRSIQNLVNKYTSLISPLKKVSPHKLRSTYGTALYNETQDIYIVADVLGHKDVNTTKKHYAAISDDIRRSVAGKVKLK